MKFGLFALLVALLVAAANVLLIGALLKVRSDVKHGLAGAAEELRALGSESIRTTVRIKQVVAIHADLRVDEPTEIDLNMHVKQQVPLKLDVKIDENLTVPLDLTINENIKVAGTPLRLDPTMVRVKADIPIRQPIKWRVALPLQPLLNIRGTVPLDHDVEINFARAVNVSGSIPVRFDLRKTIMVPVKFQVPVDQILDLELPISQRATVGFPQTLKISGMVPVEVEVPVMVPLADTPVKKHLDQLAETVGGLLGP